jgi:hypothetical protein
MNVIDRFGLSMTAVFKDNPQNVGQVKIVGTGYPSFVLSI